MKFSYQLLKKLVPEIKSKTDLIEKLSLHAFEANDLGGYVIDISVPANRYSDATSHWGIARIIAAILGRSFSVESGQLPKSNAKNFKIYVDDKNLCSRYIGWYFEIPKVTASPKWMQQVLISCGLRPINNIVDIMNYAMLETGQPLHAFDYDKLNAFAKRGKKSELKTIIVRRAKKKEKITTLDGYKFDLDENVLIIADNNEPLAIAGIKGGKAAEVDDTTKRIIVEAANFEPVGIYKTSRQINLITDASLRFAHGLSPVLVEEGIKRAAKLLVETCHAKAGKIHDVNFLKASRKILKFDIDRFNKLTGLDLGEKQCLNYLKKLGFVVKGKLVEVPPERMDISIFEDLAEEIVNLYGYNNLPLSSPHLHLKPSGYEESIGLKDEIRKTLISLGLSEVYNYSFLSKNDLERAAVSYLGGGVLAPENPISNQFKYLRPSLSAGLLKNVEGNSRFYEDVKIFEIGKAFVKNQGKNTNEEKLLLGIAIGAKKGNPVLEIKGLVEGLLDEVGLTDYFMPPMTIGGDLDMRFLNPKESLRIESDHNVLGFLGSVVSGNVAIAEIDLGKLLNLAVGEKEFEPLAKYPEIIRDLSIIIPRQIKSSEIFETVENSAPKYLDDVDLVDVYEDPKIGEDRQSLTLRFVFLADDRTLTDEEVGKEMVKIVSALEEKFDAEVR